MKLFKKYLKEKKVKQRRKVAKVASFAVVTGLVVGLLFAPESGKKSREDISSHVKKAAKKTKKTAVKIKKIIKREEKDVEKDLKEITGNIKDDIKDVKDDIKESTEEVKEKVKSKIIDGAQLVEKKAKK